MDPLISAISSPSQESPDSTRVNEDTYYFSGTNDDIYLLVADGASVRVPTTTLDRFIATTGINATAASFAARLTRDTIASTISRDVRPTPASLLLAANAALRSAIEEIYGGITSDAILKVEPDLRFLRDDPRLIRLVLPICVATVVQIDLNASTMHVAHAGDTALFVRYKDDTVIRVTNDNMEQHDMNAIRVAREKQHTQEGIHFSEMLNDERTRSLNRRNGLYHNYVDEAGNTDASIGVGAINGLPELVEYIQQEAADVRSVRNLLVCSDGFVWPAVWDESETQRAARWQHMMQTIAVDGLRDYVRRLRATEEDDYQLDAYPRFKVHDDASAIYVELPNE